MCRLVNRAGDSAVRMEEDRMRFPFPKLGTDNYVTWHVNMQFLLRLKGLLSAVTNAEDPHSDAALGLIGMNVSESQQVMVLGCATAKEAWDTLGAAYNTSSKAKIQSLKQQLNSLKMEPLEKVTQYVARAVSLKNQLLAAGRVVEEEDLVMAVMAGLPDEYRIITTFMENANEEFTLAEMQAKLILTEQRIEPKYPQETALYTKVNKARGGGGGGSGNERVCWYCQKPGHLKADCPKRRREQPVYSLSADHTVVL